MYPFLLSTQFLLTRQPNWLLDTSVSLCLKNILSLLFYVDL